MGGVKVVGKKVAIGRSNTIPQYNTPTLHAEIDALNKLPRYYFSKGKGVDLYVFRFSSDGTLRSSRPCFHCLRTMSNYNIQYVYYSADDGKIHKEKFSEMMDSELTIVSSGMRRQAVILQLQKRG
jgi:tRNA(Arg) A34 adenosine deaminase TadA